jgi:hypothetical protein
MRPTELWRASTDYVMGSGDSAMLNGKGTTLIYAFDNFA